MLDETAARLEERLAPYGSDAILAAYLTAIALLFRRSEEALRWDDKGSGWRRMLDPTRSPEWALPWLANLVGSPALAGLTPEQVRKVVRDAPYLARGSLGAIVAAARMFLAEDATVVILERTASPYTYAVQTYPSETVTPNLLEVALKAEKPAGLLMTYIYHEGMLIGTFEAMTETWPTIADAESAFTTIAELEAHVP